MIGLDTNILIRFLIKDDIKQANKVLKLFESADKKISTFLYLILPLLKRYGF